MGFDAQHGHRASADPGVDHHGGVGVRHARPAFGARVVGVADRRDHRADVEGLLAIRVVRGGEDLPHRRELARVRIVRHVPGERVGGLGPARARLARGHPGALVVPHQDAERAGQVRRPVLGLPVGAHHAVVAADAEVVLGRDPAGEVQRLLAGQHHGRIGGHDQDALGVHQHGRLGVPVRLRADVDAGHHDVDLATRLGELDDAAQRGAHPVHVLGAGIHRDPRPRAERVPLHRDAELLGQVEGGDDPAALRLGHGAQAAGRVAGEHHAGDPVRVERGAGGHLAADDAGLVPAGRTVDRHQPVGFARGDLGEVEFDQFAAAPGQRLGELVGVDQPAAAGAQHLGGVVVQRLQRLGGRRFDGRGDALARLGVEADRQPGGRLAVVDEGALGQHLLDAGAVRQRGELALQRHHVAQVDVDLRPDVDPDVVHVQLVALGPPRGAGPPDRLQAVLHRPFGVRQAEQPALLVADGGELVDLGHRDQPAIGRIGLRHAFEEQDAAGRRQPGGVEFHQPPEVEPAEDHRVDAADPLVLGQAVRPGTEGEVVDIAVRRTGRDHDPAHPLQRPAGQPGLQQRGQLGMVERDVRAVRAARRTRPGQVDLDDRLAAGPAGGQPFGDDGRDRAVGSEFVRFGDGGDGVTGTAVQDVIGEDHRALVDGERLDAGELAIAVVLAGEHLDQRLVGADTVAQPLGQGEHEPLRDGRQRGDPVGVVGGVRVGGQIGHLAGDGGEHLLAFGVHLRLVEPAEPDGPRHVADRREAALGGAHQPLQLGPGGHREVGVGGGLADPAVEDGQHHLDVGSHPLLGQEDPEDRLFERGGAVEFGDAVVGERLGEPLRELVGQAGALGVQAAQVAVEVLTVGVDPQLGVVGLAGRPVAAQLGQIGVEREERDLTGDDVRG